MSTLKFVTRLLLYVLLVNPVLRSQDFEITDKLSVSATQGDIIFHSDLGSIQFSNSLQNNHPMINMFKSGTNNSTRMFVAHSPSFTGWGIMYNDTSDAFTWIGDNLPVFQVQLAGQQRVGVGTFSPQAKLHVNSNSIPGVGQLKLTETQLDYSRITMNNNLFNNFWDIAAITESTLNNAQLNIYHSDVGDILSINAGRNIGINDAAPIWPLELNGVGKTRALNVYNDLPTTNSASFNYGVIVNLSQQTNSGFPRLFNLYGFSTDSDSYLSYGVYGFSSNAQNFNYGVYGVASTTMGYAGYFSGNTYCTGSYVASDQLLKSDIQPIGNSLKIIAQLRPTEYYQNNAYSKDFNLNETKQYGLVAQELEKVLPSLVKDSFQPYDEPKSDLEEDQGMWFKAVNYDGLIPILIAAIQEQSEIIKQQEYNIEQLEKRISSMETKNSLRKD